MRPSDIRWASRWRPVLMAIGLSALVGCSTVHYTVNDPLSEGRRDTGYAIRHLEAPNNSDSMVVLIAFSGGGYRAAALAFAVMEVLRDTPIRWEGHERSMLDEVDFISAVSGGSLTAAYFALRREAFFESFESRVLTFDLQAALTARILSVGGLWRQTSARFGRSDLLQEVLDERVFDGARFMDLPRRRPMVFINATDMRYGERFEFSQDQFDHLCSDLGSFPVARAVAASMAVPMLFSPVTLWNHGERCEVVAPRLPLQSRAGTSRHVHLVDGGLADNTGVQAPLEIIEARGGLVGSAHAAGLRGVSKRVFIVVNAQVNPDHLDDESPNTPGLLRQLRSAVDVPMDRYSQTSIRLLEDATRQWARDLQSLPEAALGGAMVRDTSFHVIEISLMKAQDGPEKDRLKRIATSLRLGRDDLAALRRFARRTLDADPQWQQLLDELQAPPIHGIHTTGVDDDGDQKGP